MQCTLKRPVILLITGALLVAATGTARAGEGDGWNYAGGEYCRDSSYECVREAAHSYLRALEEHDGDFARLAPMVKRTVIANENIYTRDELAESLDDSEDVINSVHAADWVVDGDQAIAFYALDASYEERGVGVAQTWLAERFHITNGEIDEIEAVIFIGVGVGNTSRGWLRGTPVGAPRDEVLVAAKSLIDAQVSGDYTTAALASDVRRTLNGKDTARNRSMVEILTSPFGPATYQVRDTRMYIDARTGEAAVFAALDEGSEGGHMATVLLAQRFRVIGGLVSEIEQVAWPIPGSEPTPTGWET